ncbi:formyltetrahydrofolate deformylase [Phototrophicus methaneseepsis]|uniref:Formyltetrahydrofolate deformylase n=1 Tax=Phototrophicus methaneseepsis TaxID=2710758 RepID=A0A7S8E799_9CHLR|nr:formyltetrahydrofolate deformylase [Phototrophicus methaneseepsis]QPC81608.1 formyltetrahydrofolate deformylase [Phototrophicus methaneseepsis]
MVDQPSSAILLVSCPDQPGLVAAITQFIFQHQGNILHLDQHVDQQENVFFMRVEWDMVGFELSRDAVAQAFQPIGDRYQMHWRLHFSDERLKMVLFVSKQAHALYDILSRWQSGEFAVDIPMIISNHADLESVAKQFDIPFHMISVKGDKKEAEQAQLDLLDRIQPDFIVLARYMQIVSDAFIQHYENRIINIHHSFLPAFIGARPYHQAYARGVKIIGATSHYVTADLDAGPIIEQDVARVTHKDSVRDMIRKGQDLEKTVLSRAVYYHLQHRVLVYHNKTVVFA